MSRLPDEPTEIRQGKGETETIEGHGVIHNKKLDKLDKVIYNSHITF